MSRSRGTLRKHISKRRLPCVDAVAPRETSLPRTAALDAVPGGDAAEDVLTGAQLVAALSFRGASQALDVLDEVLRSCATSSANKNEMK